MSSVQRFDVPTLIFDIVKPQGVLNGVFIVRTYDLFSFLGANKIVLLCNGDIEAYPEDIRYINLVCSNSMIWVTFTS